MARGKADTFGFYQRRGSRFWWTLDPVTRRDASTRCVDLGAAKLWRAAREQIAANPAIAAAALATLGDECWLMVEALRAAGRPTAYYEHKLGHWIRILGNDCSLAEAGSPAGFDRFITQRRTEVSDHTISKEIKCMVTTLKQAKRAGRWAGDLATLRPLGFSAGYVPRTRALTLEELAAILPELDDEPQAFVALVVALGIRRGEVLALRPGDVDTVRWLVAVRGTKTKAAARVLPVLDAFRPLVAAAAKLLPLTWGRNASYYTRYLAVRCRAVGIPAFTPNDLRRTHATLLRNAGVQADTARTLLGHTKGSQLLEQVYDAPRPAELAARAGALPALASPLASLAESLQGTPIAPKNLVETRERHRPWGPGSYPAPEERQAVSGSGPSESGSEGVGSRAESLQVAETLRLAIAARAALWGKAPAPGDAVPVEHATRRPSRSRDAG